MPQSLQRLSLGVCGGSRRKHSPRSLPNLLTLDVRTTMGADTPEIAAAAFLNTSVKW